MLSINHLTDAYLNIPAKFIEALVVCRLASGSRQNIEVDRGVLDAQLSFLGDDGLTYCPTDTLAELIEQRPFSEVWGEGRLLLALSMLAQVDDDPRWAEAAKRKVDRFLELSRHKDGFRFLWKGRYSPGDNPPADADEPSKPREGGSLADYDPFFSIIYSTGALGHGSGLLYRVTGYEPALELSEGLAKWALARVFTREDGRWSFYHFHHSLYSLMAVCEYGAGSGDRAALERVDACYRWAREMGDPLIGYFPEYMAGSDNYLERRGEHYGGLRGGRHALPGPILDQGGDRRLLGRRGPLDPQRPRRVPDARRRVRGRYPGRLSPQRAKPEAVPRLQGHGRPIGRLVLGMDERQRRHPPEQKTEQGPKLKRSSIMHCCTANGARALYYVWDAMLRQDGDETTVELLLNRASPWLDVDSYLPVEGKVVLNVKQTRSVRVRMPEWSSPERVRATVGGKDAQLGVQGRYVRVDGLNAGDEVTLMFPVPEHTEHRVIGESAYKLTLRGSNVVSIDPEGSIYPLYARQPTGASVAKERFVPDIQSLVW